ALQGDKPALDHGLVAELHVIAGQPGVRAHGSAVRCGDLPIDEHLVEDEAGEALRLAVACEAPSLAIVGRDVDGRARHQLAPGVLDQLGGYLWHVGKPPLNLLSPPPAAAAPAPLRLPALSP